MISPKKFLKMVKKWQREAHKMANNKGHFVIYTTDQKRFVIPLAHLNSNIFRELFKMSEDKFGLPRDGPIMLPCEAVFMKYIVSIIQKGVGKDLEKALLVSVAASRWCPLSSLHQGEAAKQSLVCGC